MLNPIRSWLPAVMLVLGCQTSAASTWIFASGGDYYVTTGSTYGNRVTFYDGFRGVETLRTTAWSNTADTPVNGFETAYLRRFSTGLGVCNREEGAINDCIAGGLDHQVDNISQQDLVLFLFPSTQAMQSLVIDPYGVWDRDVSFWVGNVSPGIDLTGATFGTLAALGFSGQVNSLNSAGDAALSINLGGLVGNALLMGALNPADGTADRFKIRSLTTTTTTTVVPVPGAAWLFVSALGSLAGLRRFR